MRKKTVTHVADTIFWYLLYFLPVILTLIQSIGIFEQFGFEGWRSIASNGAITDFEFMHLLQHNLESLFFMEGNLITELLADIFGSGGMLPFFYEDWNPIFMYFGYFVVVYLIHLCVDFILFIPRIAHKWLNKFTKECE